MGRRGPKASASGIRQKGWTFYPDRETERILGKHLAAMKARNPRSRVTVSQVLRLIVRQADDDEWLGFVLELQEAAAKAKDAQEEAGRREQEARRRVEEILNLALAAEERRDSSRHPDVQTALRAMRNPRNEAIRQNLQSLLAAEAAGKTGPEPLPVLAAARRHLGSYVDLSELLGGSK